MSKWPFGRGGWREEKKDARVLLVTRAARRALRVRCFGRRGERSGDAPAVRRGSGPLVSGGLLRCVGGEGHVETVRYIVYSATRPDTSASSPTDDATHNITHAAHSQRHLGHRVAVGEDLLGVARPVLPAERAVNDDAL